MDRHVVEQRPEVQHLLERVSSDDNVRGLVLTGSWAREMATQHSDIDIYVVVESAQGWVTTRSEQIDLPVCSMADLRALPVEPSQWWNRYSFVDAQLLLDRTAGELDALVHAWATLNAAEVDRCLETYLDGYINFAYRSLKAEREGRQVEQRLDAVESIGWMLWVVFAVFGRVRPYNKYLRYELQRRPLDGAGWTELDLMGHLGRLMDSGDAAAQRDIFREVERSAASSGTAPPSTNGETSCGSSVPLQQPITDKGVAVGGAFDSDTAVGTMPIAHSRRRCVASWQS